MSEEKNAQKRRFIRFDPTINSGHLLTIFMLAVTSLFAWDRLSYSVSTLTEENKARRAEIERLDSARHADRAEWMLAIKDSQDSLREEIKEWRKSIIDGFTRIDDKLEHKEDKHVR